MVICPALIGGFVAWVAVCYDGPVHPSMAFLLTGIISVRSVSQRFRGRMLPWVTTLHNPRRKYHPVIFLGGDSELFVCLLSRSKREATLPFGLGCGVFSHINCAHIDTSTCSYWSRTPVPLSHLSLHLRPYAIAPTRQFTALS